MIEETTGKKQKYSQDKTLFISVVSPDRETLSNPPSTTHIHCKRNPVRPTYSFLQ